MPSRALVNIQEYSDTGHDMGDRRRGFPEELLKMLNLLPFMDWTIVEQALPALGVGFAHCHLSYDIVTQQ